MFYKRKLLFAVNINMFIHGLLHGTRVPVALHVLLGALYIDVQTGASPLFLSFETP